MEIETRQKENGTEITVRSSEKVAIVVQGEEERIYLPDPGSSSGTYYIEESSGIETEGDLYRVEYPGEIDDLKVFEAS